MALSNRINMRGGSGVPSGNYIFKNGHFIVPMSANQFSRSGYTMTMPSQDSSGNLILTTDSNYNYCIAGTAYPIDLTDVNAITFKIKSTEVYADTGVYFGVQRTTAIGSDQSAVSQYATSVTNDFVTYTINTQSLTGTYYVWALTTSPSRKGLVSEIYLV